MTLVLFALLLQASSPWVATPRNPTVGDSVYLTRRLATTADVRARVQPLGGEAGVEPLAPPRWFYSEGELAIVYVVSLFEPGQRGFPMPDAELVYADGRVETLAGDTAWIDVVAVLPPLDSAVAPMPSRGPIARPPTSWLPLVVLLVAVVLGTTVWTLIRWRPVRRPRGPHIQAPPAEAPLDLWVAAGEPRAVAAVAADRLRQAVATWLPAAGRHLHTEECIRVVLAQRRGEIGRRVADALRSLERARFSPAASADVLDVADAAEAVIATLVSQPRES